MSDLLKPGEVVSFEVYPTSVLGNDFKNLTVAAILDAETARTAIPGGFDAPAMHANVFNSLPEGTPNNYNRYYYVKLKHPNGTFRILGIPWIKPESITSIVVNRGIFTIDGIGIDDVNIIRQAIAGAGYKVKEYVLE